MKFLFIVQGDGRGHMTQAITLADMLYRHSHEVVEVLIGKGKSRDIPEFVYNKFGEKCRIYDAPSFVFSKDQKHVNIFKTFIYNTTPKKLQNYSKSIEFIKHRIEETKPDVVVNFYEVLSSLTHLRFHIKVPFVNIGHQYLSKHHEYIHARGEEQSLMIFRLHTLLCSIDAVKTLALSFYPLKDCKPQRLTVVPPLLRKEIHELQPVDGDYILGYIVNAGYEKEVNEWHKKNPDVKLDFFWDKKNVPKVLKVDDTLTFHSLDDKKFLEYMAACKGYISTAGFESICEAMYLNKPVMVIPAHVEQEINARDAASTGNAVMGNSFDISKLISFIEGNSVDNSSYKKWVDSAEEIFIKQLTF